SIEQFELSGVMRTGWICIALAQPQPCQWTRNNRLHSMTQRQSFFNLLKQIVACNPEFLTRSQLGNDVVVIGIEPFGHFAGRYRSARRCAPPSHAEQGVKRDRLSRRLPETRWNRP